LVQQTAYNGAIPGGRKVGPYGRRRGRRDEVVSASKKALITREGGGALNCALRPGDHVIFPKLGQLSAAIEAAEKGG